MIKGVHLVKSVRTLQSRTHIARLFSTSTPHSVEKIKELLEQNPNQYVKVGGADIDGIMRGKYMQKKKFLSALKGGLGFCNVIFGWDAADQCYDNVKYTGNHTAYPDTKAKIDVDTFRTIPWEKNMPFFLMDYYNDDGTPSNVCPRNLLKKVIDHSRKMGYEPLIGVEYEWYNFEGKSGSNPDNSDPKHYTPGMFGYSCLRTSQRQEFYHDIMNKMNAFSIPLEGFHTETGPGAMEAAIVFGKALESADRGLLFKLGVKELAYQHNAIPSFMAKPSSSLPGCGGHIHQNLADLKNGTNLFYSEHDKHNMSDLFKSYLAGQLALLPEFLPFFAPTINSYKRLVDGFWAPTTPTWGIDNRTVGIRVLPHSANACRLEFRVTGADINPYISIAASVAAGLWGVAQKLQLKQEPIIGSGYIAQKQGLTKRLPHTLSEATNELAKSKVARELLGEDFVDHFVETRRWEVRQFNNEVTDWEKRRYFEII
eukprot:TRINITY_DN5362_c0_g1_i1.p1 TRINITY_DN5362_c0_g1~~TRINITY_DN5362_c0_g1_i1.p1  ORF type:complete len:483 (-),score=90.20 TRINITY_DN5362_c0_g1_i1:87-1535(-)